ncbi:MAG: hypothetical protein IAF02_05335 [Anaerolineae bacterium]|nr:hypothetical protein [Anaerolineae bacterium]
MREGVRRAVLLWEGKYQSAIVMSMLRDEWLGMGQPLPPKLPIGKGISL